ncbi:MAG: pectin esterase [Porphyromonadaceae bacterium]|nr:pectin esterase [Porphyromonadaceae bacterium]
MRLFFSTALLLVLFSISFAETPVKHITVDINGTGNFTSLQEAIFSVRAFDPDGATQIFVKNGVYREKIVIPEWVCNVIILGESRENTIITHNDHANINKMGTFRTYTLQIRGNDIKLENLTVENNAEQLGQAVALHTEGDRLIFKHCRFLGNQDTQYLAGEGNRLYFENCYIEGTTDFIFGGATAWFEKCDIYCKKNSYITAASTPENIKYGFIFNQCKISVAKEVNSMYLGRPWRAYAMTVFMNCELPGEINPAGWNNWRNPENEKTARYAEYNNSGKGSDTTQRVKWIKILSKKEGRRITLKRVFNDFYYNIQRL